MVVGQTSNVLWKGKWQAGWLACLYTGMGTGRARRYGGDYRWIGGHELVVLGAWYGVGGLDVCCREAGGSGVCVLCIYYGI